MTPKPSRRIAWMVLAAVSSGACTEPGRAFRSTATLETGHEEGEDWRATSPRAAFAKGAEKLSFEIDSVRFDLVRIPAGEFDMGSPVSEVGHDENETLRHVTIFRPFYLGQYEITQAQYAVVMGGHASSKAGVDLPVDEVQFDDALAFCERLSERTGLHVRLPTSAQWEYACRAGTTTRYYSGDLESDLERIAWYRRTTHDYDLEAGGQKLPNAFGLYDMIGNATEPCLDTVEGGAEDNRDYGGGVESFIEIMRGCGPIFDAEECRAAKSFTASYLYGRLGIRIAATQR